MGRLKKEIFRCIVEHTPLVSIDFLIKKEDKYLLGKRVNPPAKDYYFTIGGRIFKNETIEKAKKRILQEELNISTHYSLLTTYFLGVFEHFYEDSIFRDNISTHYINLAYLIDLDKVSKIDLTNIPFEQHSEYIWLSKEEILKRYDVHKYVKDYLVMRFEY